MPLFLPINLPINIIMNKHICYINLLEEINNRKPKNL